MALPAGAADEPVSLAPVVIRSHYDNAVGTSDAASQGVIRAELLKSRPALRPGEVLEFVPGLIVTQHSGDGKANQYFLRGFNLDHGTDFATRVDGLPVNQPTHGHSHGYSDLNFLIPELVDRIDYRKGPYFATQGDFASAGGADIHYKQRLEAPFAQLTLGERSYRRGVGAGSVEWGEDLSALGALEWMHNDGPWSVPEGLLRRNGLVKFTQGTAAQGVTLDLMSYDARWTATDQVPQRLISAGVIDRFGSLDPTDGGSASRSSLSAGWHRRDERGLTELAAYAMRHRFELFSNFTYALDRPATGDQIGQRDNRRTYGLSALHRWDQDWGGLPAVTELGLQARRDLIAVGLDDTQARQRVASVRNDQVQATALAAYGQVQLRWRPWLRSVLGARLDHQRLTVNSLEQPVNSGQAQATRVSPKLALIAAPWTHTELFASVGRGLHSNDARGVTQRADPRSGDPAEPVPALVASRGAELGWRTEAWPGLQSSWALWRLDFDSELFYVGDAGSNEARGPSRRRGVEWNNRWTLAPHWLVDADLAWTHARFANGDRIPNAVDRVASAAVTLKDLGPWSTSLQWRYLGTSPLLEDNSVRSTAALTANLRLTRALNELLGPGSDLTLDVFNLFNRRVNDIEYWYVSRLPSEAAEVADRHLHPAEPRTLRVTLRVSF